MKINCTLTYHSAPSDDQSQVFRLQKIGETETYFLNEIDEREKLAKKIKRFNTILSVLNKTLISATVVTSGISIAALASGVGLPVGLALSGASLLLSCATTITRRRQKKHEKIMLVAQAKLDSINDTISKAIQDENVSHEEFSKILQETDKYRKLKNDIRTQHEPKQKSQTITKNNVKPYL